MRVAQVDPGALDARAIGFRLAPRINAAGRLHRADAGLELLLTDDEARADARSRPSSTRGTPSAATPRPRILFAAEAQVAETGDAPAYVLAGEGWHPGVIGIVASRIAERHHRPCVLRRARRRPRAPARAARSRRSTCSAGSTRAPRTSLRHGGHRAAAGCTIARDDVDAFRAAFAAHAARGRSTPEDLVPRERVDAVVAGDELGLDLAEELERLAPFGIGNPRRVAAGPRRAAVRPAADGGGQAPALHRRGRRCARARGARFGDRRRLPERRATDGRSTRRSASSSTSGTARSSRGSSCAARSRREPGADRRSSASPRTTVAAALAELDAPLEPRAAAAGAGVVRAAPRRPPRRRRGRRHRRRCAARASRCSSPAPTRAPAGATSPGASAASRCARGRALERDPALAAPLRPRRRARPAAASRGRDAPALGGAHGAMVHLRGASGELRFALAGPRARRAPARPARRAYRALRAARGARRPRSRRPGRRPSRAARCAS